MINPMKQAKVLPKSPFPHWLAFFLLTPLRKFMVPRDSYIRKTGVGVGNRVLELGCGPGFFTEYIAKIITTSGKVYAQDVQPQLIENLKKRMQKFEVTENIEPLLCSSTDIELPNTSIDVVFAANVFEEIEKEGLLEKTASEVNRLLKHAGHITVIEHRLGVSKNRFEKIINALKKEGLKPIRRRITPFMHFAWLEKTTP